MTVAPRLDAYRFHERSWESYEQLRAVFEWEVPGTFNMATYLCDRWDDRDDAAIHAAEASGRERTVTFAELRRSADALADYFAAEGVGRGDRIGINAPQKPETLIAHLAAWKLGAVSVPTSVLFGDDALRYRLADANVTACVVDRANVETLRRVRDDAGIDLTLTVDVPDRRPDEVAFSDAVEAGSGPFETVATDPEETALVVYTSGTTGEPKGVVHGHRLLLGQLPHFLCSFCNLTIADDDTFYAPIEWAWIAVFNFVVPALFYGRPVVAYAGESFDPHTTFELLDRYGVTCFGAPPTALREMATVDAPADRYDLDAVRVVEAGGESLGADVAMWARGVFDATVHEHYGQTEADVLVGDCTALFPRRTGAMGRPLPGHEVAVLDPETLEPVAAGTVGELAVGYDGDPVCFEQYWNELNRTAAKVRDGWLLTGDFATVDADGYVSFRGRTDDVIIRSGYRIDPAAIEETLSAHDAVVDAGVIGIPDERRGEVPKAYVVPAAGRDADGLAPELRTHVKERLARYEYPSEFEFVGELPTTVTGKIERSALGNRDVDEEEGG